jgi:hypothetical protein
MWGKGRGEVQEVEVPIRLVLAKEKGLEVEGLDGLV